VGDRDGVEDEWPGAGAADKLEWVDALALRGLEAEALGHKGHALYRQRHLITEALRLLCASVCLSSKVLTSAGRAVGQAAARSDGALCTDAPRAAADTGDEWRHEAAVVGRDVSATRVIALGTLGDVCLALGYVRRARVVYSACRILVHARRRERWAARDACSPPHLEVGIDGARRLPAGGAPGDLAPVGGLAHEWEGWGEAGEALQSLKLPPHQLLAGVLWRGEDTVAAADDADAGGEDDDMDGRCLGALLACLGDSYLRFEEWHAVVECGERARARALQQQHARIMCKGSYLVGYGKMMLEDLPAVPRSLLLEFLVHCF